MNKLFVNHWLAPRQFENPLLRMLDEPTESHAFVPAADVSEFDSEYQIRVSLPGLEKKDIKVEVNDDQITISGTRGARREEANGRTHLREIYYGSFSRTFTVPTTISEEGIRAKFESGLLELTVPKVEAPKARLIEIQ